MHSSAVPKTAAGYSSKSTHGPPAEWSMQTKSVAVSSPTGLVCSPAVRRPIRSTGARSTPKSRFQLSSGPSRRDAGGGISMRSTQPGERLAVGLNDACTIRIGGRNADRITVAAVSPQGAFQPLERGSAAGEWKLSDIADLGEKDEILIYIKIGRAHV